MGEYIEKLEEYLNGERYFTKAMYKISSTIYRIAQKRELTIEEVRKFLDSLGGNSNEEN